MRDGTRAAGILLAASSLDGPWGIGTFGAEARRWVDFLAEAGQTYWQILPLGPTGWGDSPYQSLSAFALSPYYIDPGLLCEEGLLSGAEAENAARGSTGADSERTDYAALYADREPLLRKAHARFLARADGDAEYRRFLAESPWLSGYALFMAIKQKYAGRAWLAWEKPLRCRDGAALRNAAHELAAEVEYHRFVQFLAFRQWRALKAYANGRGVLVIGDMPIYVALDSADTWAESDLFQLDAERRPLRVAGCPPDPFSETGQRWGNPLYDWDHNAGTGFAWWLERLRAAFRLYDVVRIDHFRGFESYYSIDAAARDARDGKWVKGPDAAFINAVKEALPGAAIIAEDLGYLTGEVRALLARSGFPGMKIVQFAFDSREPGSRSYMPHNYERNSVVYTGTHDNDTALGWFNTARREDTALARDYLGLAPDSAEGNWAFIRAALSSVADLAVIPLQDYLGLDSRARMNTPATLGGSNWQWRMKRGAADAALAAKIRRLTEISGRSLRA
ncbi:MAG: 4-alpha-glucanotransferase [Spirochaetaceae bacterium]|jgi:4-alpha-glucanotransferase|nr:4-alpha-glucanotransferase [Spirochaetaceae bacterium]